MNPRAHKRAVSVQNPNKNRVLSPTPLAKTKTNRFSSSIDITKLVEELTKGEKDSRKLHNMKARFSYSQMTPLFDSFCIIGSNGSAASTTPEILYKFQITNALNVPSFNDVEGLTSFCFPNGIERVSINKKDRAKFQAYIKEKKSPQW